MSAAVFRFRNILVLFDVGALVDYELSPDNASTIESASGTIGARCIPTIGLGHGVDLMSSLRA